MKPVIASFSTTRGQWRSEISRSTSPRIVTASACAPVLPDWPATTGISTASAVNLAMSPSNEPTTAAARNAVTRLICSQGRRLRTAKSAGESARSSLLAPTIVARSSLLSLRNALNSSAWRITPSSRPSALTTGSVLSGVCCSTSTTSSRGARSVTTTGTERISDRSSASREASTRSSVSTRPVR